MVSVDVKHHVYFADEVWELASRFKMVSAWYMNKSDSDERDECKGDPHQPVSLGELEKKTGVQYLPVSDCMVAQTAPHEL